MTKQEIIDWHKAHPYGARDEAYMEAVFALLKREWLKHPKERLGQLLVNHISADRDSRNGHPASLNDVFYRHDEDLVP